MLTRFTLAATALLGFTLPAFAVPIAGGETTVDVTADLVGLGLSGAPFGLATVDVSGATPVFAFPITGGDLLPTGALIEHEGSGVTLTALGDPLVSVTVGDFLIDTAQATIFGDVIGGAQDLALFDLGPTTPGGIEIAITAQLAGALTTVFGADDLTGATFGVAVTAPNPIPLPAAGWMLIAGIGALAAMRRRET